jgi:ABC-type multidrug transport system fused ATPase/permease subunit
MFIVSGLLKLFADLCGLIGPLSISCIVEFISLQLSNATAASGFFDGNFHNATNDNDTMMNHPDWAEFIADGWVMSGIVLVAFLLQGTFSQASTNLINMEGIKVKNALQGLIYRKTLSLSASCFHRGREKDENTAGTKHDDDCDLNNPGTITNLMSDDSLNIMTFFWICHYVWSIPLKVSSHQSITARTLWLFNCGMVKVINTILFYSFIISFR